MVQITGHATSSPCFRSVAPAVCTALTESSVKASKEARVVSMNTFLDRSGPLFLIYASPPKTHAGRRPVFNRAEIARRR